MLHVKAALSIRGQSEGHVKQCGQPQWAAATARIPQGNKILYHYSVILGYLKPHQPNLVSPDSRIL